MDYQKAIEILAEVKKVAYGESGVYEAFDTAISAMQELQEYKEYGTPNGYKSALEAYDKCYYEKEIIDTELYKYQQIGSLEEVREAVEKHENDCSRCREKIYKHAIKKFSCLQEIDIKAYEELMSYRRIGTIKEVREAVEKQKKKKPKGDLHSVPHYRCPNCNSTVKLYQNSKKDEICKWCGQRIEWSEVKNEQ